MLQDLLVAKLHYQYKYKKKISFYALTAVSFNKLQSIRTNKDELIKLAE